MKKLSTKIFIVIFSCALISVAVLGMLSVVQSNKQARKDAEATLQWMAKDYADKFSTELSVIEDRLVEMELFVQNTLDYEALRSDRDYLGTYEQELALYVQEFANYRTESLAGWVYFDPKWSDESHDVYFVDGNGDGLADRQEKIPLSYYDNTPLPEDDKQWWYGPKEKQGVFWTNPYEWRLINGDVIQVVSCARPIYIEGEFVGVVGTYYRFEDMYSEITSIKAYDSGRAMLFNEKLDFVIHSEYKAGTRFTSDNLQTMEGGRHKEVGKKINSADSGIVPVESAGVDKMLAFAKLSNGWVLAIDPPVKEIYAGAYKLVFNLVFAIIMCVCVGFIVAYYMGKYLANPILKLAETVKVIGTGDLSVRAQVNTKDETHLLAEALNHMAGNIAHLQEELIRQAYFDDLTGARNLRKFKLDAAVLLEERGELSYTLVKLDIAKFKMLNELYGFNEGDRILKNFADALSEALSPERDTFARITADEFIILVSESERGDIERKYRLFRQAFLRMNANAHGYRILFKEGRYSLEAKEIDVTDAFEKVNLAHRIAKGSNSNHVYCYDDTIRQIAKKERRIEDGMEKALANGEFQLYLQAKYRLSDETIAGAEALVRWKKSDGELVSPGNFIPLFERNGFITKLDFYMLEEVCKTIQNWIREGIPVVPVSVNFSRRHLSGPYFVRKLQSILQAYNMPPQVIEVELTETAMLDGDKVLAKLFQELHNIGVTLSIDDFGTGYSSLGLLKNLPVDVVKLDRSFFVGAEDEKRALSVIESVISMAKKLGICTVAEGVEERKYVELLKAYDCDLLQGYYYARPIPEIEFTKELKDSTDV